jgi:hypothetical protein
MEFRSCWPQTSGGFASRGHLSLSELARATGMSRATLSQELALNFIAQHVLGLPSHR